MMLVARMAGTPVINGCSAKRYSASLCSGQLRFPWTRQRERRPSSSWRAWFLSMGARFFLPGFSQCRKGPGWPTGPSVQVLALTAAQILPNPQLARRADSGEPTTELALDHGISRDNLYQYIRPKPLNCRSGHLQEYRAHFAEQVAKASRIREATAARCTYS